MVDTHCHLTDRRYDDIAAVITRSEAAGITRWVNVGCSLADTKDVIEMAAKYEKMVATAGIHPHEAEKITDGDIDELAKLAEKEKIVAIGETGFDFFYDTANELSQKKLFISHIKIATKLNLPMIIHSRDAFEQTLEVLNEYGKNLNKVVFHCYGGDDKQAKILIEKGYYISFTGVVTFKNADKARTAAVAVPLEKMMIETDCPYMSPVPVRNQKTNEPAFLIHTAKFLAKLKNIEIERFKQVTTANAVEFFALK